MIFFAVSFGCVELMQLLFCTLGMDKLSFFRAAPLFSAICVIMDNYSFSAMLSKEFGCAKYISTGRDGKRIVKNAVIMDCIVRFLTILILAGICCGLEYVIENPGKGIETYGYEILADAVSAHLTVGIIYLISRRMVVTGIFLLSFSYAALVMAVALRFSLGFEWIALAVQALLAVIANVWMCYSIWKVQGDNGDE